MKNQFKTYSLVRCCCSFFATIVTSLLLFSCSEDDPVKATQDPFNMEVEVSSLGGKDTVSVVALADWSVSSNNSSVLEILSPKVGSAGEVAIVFEIKPNNTFKDREVKISFKDGRENVIKVVQKATDPAMSFDKEVSISYNADKNIFSDTVTISSNLGWALPEQQDEWIEELKIIGDKPQEGIPTETKLVIIAKQNSLRAAGNSSTIVLATKEEQSFSLEVKYPGFTPKMEFDTPAIILQQNELDAQEFIASIEITTNVKWDVIQTQAPWLDKVNVINESQNAIETTTQVWFTVPSQNIDTEGLSGVVEFIDVNDSFSKTLNISINSLDPTFFVVSSDDINMSDDGMFDAIAGEGAFTKGVISVHGVDPEEVTPFIFVMHNGRPRELTFPTPGYVDPVQTRAAQGVKQWQLEVAERNEQENMMGMDPYTERSCAVVFFHNSMLDEYGSIKQECFDIVHVDGMPYTYLKSEYFKNEIMYRQKGLVAQDPTFNLVGIENGGSYTLASDKKSTFVTYESNFNIEMDGIYAEPFELEWCEIYFDAMTNQVEFKAESNNTGATRREKVEFFHGKSGEKVFSVTLVQEAK